ncbi:MAG: SOS response-associated peptidase [Gemmatimonadaceae bacterium]|nr:SOS response-associated peptidase [Gemmatimonadaceae bacterium]
MCGRFTLTDPTRLDAEAIGAALVVPLTPRFNIAPTQAVPLVRQREGGGRELVLARWGLIPSWAKDAAIGNKLANARGETLAEKPSFRTAWKRRRGLVLADGFYEWQPLPGEKVKQPWWIHRRDGAPFAFGALWETWHPPEGGDPVVSCTLVTTTPNALMAPIHDRMPVILSWSEAGQWLERPAPPTDLVRPCDPDPWEAVRVSTRVNRPTYDAPDCVMSVTI